MACRQDSEAIRKLFRSIAARSRSVLAVMKYRVAARNESVQHKMYMTEIDHGSTGFYTTLIVLTVPSTPPMPDVRLLNHPAFFQGRKAFRACWTCLHFDAPAWTMLSHPGVQSVIVILLIRKDRDETRKMVWVDLAEQERWHWVMSTASNRPGVSTNRYRLLLGTRSEVGIRCKRRSNSERRSSRSKRRT